jgi:NAD(P)H dehydrogenase (quinone)
MYQKKTRVVMICVGAIESVHRLAVAVCEAAWDAGSEVRLRRIGEVDQAEESRADAMRLELIRELEEIPPATAADIEWADVALFGISPREGKVPLGFERLIEDAKRRCRPSDLGNKLYYVFSPATICHDAAEGTLLPLSDLFRRSGGSGGQASRPTRLAHRDAHAPSPNRVAAGADDAELAAALTLGRMVAEGMLSPGTKQRPLSDVA